VTARRLKEKRLKFGVFCGLSLCHWRRRFGGGR
jgi:hypothetical protein